jgi:hypothetical protein
LNHPRPEDVPHLSESLSIGIDSVRFVESPLESILGRRFEQDYPCNLKREYKIYKQKQYLKITSDARNDAN